MATLQNLFDSLQNVVAGLGTSRDKRSYTTYGFVDVLDQMSLSAMYRTSWLAKKIVNAPADDMCREWFSCQFAGESEQDEICEVEKRYSVKFKVNEAIKLARLYGGSIIVLVFMDQPNMAEPLDLDTIKPESLVSLQVIDRNRISPSGGINTDIESPNFGLPEMYIVGENGKLIHHSRVLRFDGQRLPYLDWMSNGMWHDSELQHCLDSIKNYDTTSAAIATMVFEANIDILKSPELNRLVSTADGEAKAIKRFQLSTLMKSFNRTLLLDKEDEYEKKSNSFSGLDGVVQQFMVDVAGACDIPVTRLFGRSAVGMNATGEGDLTNYYDKLAANQESDLRPLLERLYEMLYRSAFGKPSDEMKLTFNPLWQIDAVEQSGIDKTNADRDLIYLNAGIVSPTLIATELKERGTYKNMTDEDINLVEEMSRMLEEAEVDNEQTIPEPDA